MTTGHKEGVKVRSFPSPLPRVGNRSGEHAPMKNFKMLIVPVSSLIPVTVDVTALIQFFILDTKFKHSTS